MRVQEQIKVCRKKNGLTQEELAKLLGVSTMTVFRWESGQRFPRVDELSHLATVLNTTVAYLTGETDETPVPVSVPEASNNSPMADPQIVEKQNKGYLIYEDGERHIELPPTPEGYALFKELLTQHPPAVDDRSVIV